MSNVMVVEDEAHLAEGLRFNLAAEGYAVTLAGNGATALELLLDPQSTIDLVVLDVMLPGMDGFAVVSELRKQNQFVPVLMLTALARPEDVLKGLDCGADDFLPKPFNLNVLLARVRGLLRGRAWARERSATQAPSASSEEESFSFNGKTVDFASLELRSGTTTVQLTQMEVSLLQYFIRNKGVVISRKQILQDVWGLPEDIDTRAIDNFIVRLRRYIEDEPTRPRHLLTVRGVGYKFVSNSD